MKKLYSFLLLLALPVLMLAQSQARSEGWPANYGGVMLQGFYWDSWNETSWAQLEAQSDELAGSFELIWVPQSGTTTSFEQYELVNTSNGYDPLYWFKHNSIFGSEAQLRSMIQTFKTKGVGIIEDVVINHKKGLSDWCDFPTETWNGHSISWSLADICCSDECAKVLDDEGHQIYPATGAADEGTDFDGFRDLDHKSANVHLFSSCVTQIGIDPSVDQVV